MVVSCQGCSQVVNSHSSQTFCRVLVPQVRVLFDDGNTYSGVIVRKDPETNMWVTVFEDGVEDQSADPATDSDYTLLD